MTEEAARKVGMKFVQTQARLKAMNSPPDKVIGVADVVEVKICEWLGNVDFTIVWKDDYDAVLGIEFMNEYEAMIMPHLRKLNIYNGREDIPLSITTMATMRGECKITTMGVEEVKRNKEVCESLNQMDPKHMEKENITRTLSDRVLDLASRLEAMEECKNVKLETLRKED